MTVTHALFAFTAAAALLTITPGLDTALVLRTAAVEGPRRALLAGAGICLGCLVWGSAASVGLGMLLQVSRIAYGALRVAGAAYLVWLGLRMWLRSKPFLARTDEPGDTGAEPATRWFLRGLLTNLLNPKVGVFYVTFLPQFIPAGVRVTPFSMLLAGIHAALGLLWFSALTLATRPLATWLGRPRVARGLDRLTGAVFIGCGIALAVEGRR